MGNLNCNAASCITVTISAVLIQSVQKEARHANVVKHAAATMNIRNQVQLICAIFLKILYPSHVKQPTAYITLIKNVMLTMQTYQV